RIYGLTSLGRVVVLDPETAAGVVVASLSADASDNSNPFSGLNGFRFGIDFNPVPDRMRVVSNNAQNLRINVDNGATVTDGSLRLGNPFAFNVTAVAYSDNFSATCRTTTYYLDTGNDQLLSSGAPNDGLLSNVGPLGIDAQLVNGFEIFTGADGSDQGFVALSDADDRSTLHRVNLQTGAATAIGEIGTDEFEIVLSLAMAPADIAPNQAQGELIGVNADGAVVSFNSAAPGKLCTQQSISGIGAENVVGMDRRPANGDVLIVTDASRVYTLDTSSGAASNAQTLSATLNGNRFGVDFNPVADRLRIVSDSDQNLRANVDDGATVVDSTLSGAVAGASAAAYSNSFDGAANTALFAVNTVTDQLVLIGADPSGTGACDDSPDVDNPNCGISTAVGDLGLDLSATNGMELIAGASSALLAAQIDGDDASVLLDVDLASGAATPTNGSIANSRVAGAALVGVVSQQAPPAASLFGVNADGDLLQIDRADPSAVTTVGNISGLGDGETILGIDLRPSSGTLYLLTDAERLYTVDPQTAEAQLAANLAADASDNTGEPTRYNGLQGTRFGVDFNPTGPVALRIVSDGLDGGSTGQSLRVGNPDFGNTFTDGRTGYADDFSISSVAYSNNFVSDDDIGTDLFGLDLVGQRLVQILPPNDGGVIDLAPLGLDGVIGSFSGLEIIAANTAVAAVTVDGVSNLYAVNLDASQALSLIGAIGDGSGALRALTAVPAMDAPADDSLLIGLRADGTLLQFARNAPDAITETAITGLGDGETLLSIDYRPADAQLYALSSNARLYTLAEDGSATAVAELMPPAGSVEGFGGLDGSAFAIDFNPRADRLRIISDSGQNLRSAVETVLDLDGVTVLTAAGDTLLDGDLSRVAPALSAAAYANSVPGATQTTLFVIDAANRPRLAMQNAATGLLTPIGFVDAELDTNQPISLDIAGSGTGLALMSAVIAGEDRASLFSVDLGSASTARIGTGPIGAADSTSVQSIALQLQ
ncbi:MAG: DUF4394 domain-containing protein, partial [Panacagrimonas sp.]